MASYQESLLTRKITKLSQELVSLKAHQRYLTGQAKGFESNKVRVDSQDHSTPGNNYKTVYVELTVTGSLPGKTIVPTIRVQAYNSQGEPIPYTLDWWEFHERPFFSFMNEFAGVNKNEYRYVIFFYELSSDIPLDDYSIEFWVLSNTPSTIKVTATHAP